MTAKLYLMLVIAALLIWFACNFVMSFRQEK
jgi:HAMP domain-containing protein